MFLEIFIWELSSWTGVVLYSLLAAIATIILYFISFYILRSLFRKLEQDIALVTLNVSTYPALAVFLLSSLKLVFNSLASLEIIKDLEQLFTAGLIIAVSYWAIELFSKVVIYYLKDYTLQTEVMWDDVLLPLLDATVPIVIVVLGSGLVLKSFGVDLTGIWVTLGGATFVIGFAVKDILANFFSGIVLLIDTPFQFGDVLRLENGSIGMLRKIGVRVTQLYMFHNHCDMYIPNSVLQGQNITNLSRPTSYYYCSSSIEIPLECDLDRVQMMMKRIILAHPDTLGNIDRKLEFIDDFYQSQLDGINFAEQQEIGRVRLEAEQEVNFKLEEITAYLEALVLTIQFAEKGGLTLEEIDNIQQEYQEVLSLFGLENALENEECLQENRASDSLIELTRDWYRNCLKDPNLLDDDQSLISEEWERKINLLTKRTQKLWQKISNPQREETRLDDYVLELIQWLKDKYKQPRSQWQEPQVKMIGMEHEEDNIYVKFSFNFYVDDMKLEDGKRGSRLTSQIYQEVIRYFKQVYPNLEEQLTRHLAST